MSSQSPCFSWVHDLLYDSSTLWSPLYSSDPTLPEIWPIGECEKGGRSGLLPQPALAIQDCADFWDTCLAAKDVELQEGSGGMCSGGSSGPSEASVLCGETLASEEYPATAALCQPAVPCPLAVPCIQLASSPTIHEAGSQMDPDPPYPVIDTSPSMDHLHGLNAAMFSEGFLLPQLEISHALSGSQQEAGGAHMAQLTPVAAWCPAGYQASPLLSTLGAGDNMMPAQLSCLSGLEVHQQLPPTGRVETLSVPFSSMPFAPLQPSLSKAGASSAPELQPRMSHPTRRLKRNPPVTPPLASGLQGLQQRATHAGSKQQRLQHLPSLNMMSQSGHPRGFADGVGLPQSMPLPYPSHVLDLSTPCNPVQSTQLNQVNHPNQLSQVNHLKHLSELQLDFDLHLMRHSSLDLLQQSIASHPTQLGCYPSFGPTAAIQPDHVRQNVLTQLGAGQLVNTFGSLIGAVGQSCQLDEFHSVNAGLNDNCQLSQDAVSQILAQVSHSPQLEMMLVQDCSQVPTLDSVSQHEQSGVANLSAHRQAASNEAGLSQMSVVVSQEDCIRLLVPNPSIEIGLQPQVAQQWLGNTQEVNHHQPTNEKRGDDPERLNQLNPLSEPGQLSGGGEESTQRMEQSLQLSTMNKHLPPHQARMDHACLDGASCPLQCLMQEHGMDIMPTIQQEGEVSNVHRHAVMCASAGREELQLGGVAALIAQDGQHACNARGLAQQQDQPHGHGASPGPDTKSGGDTNAAPQRCSVHATACRSREHDGAAHSGAASTRQHGSSMEPQASGTRAEQDVSLQLHAMVTRPHDDLMGAHACGAGEQNDWMRLQAGLTTDCDNEGHRSKDGLQQTNLSKPSPQPQLAPLCGDQPPSKRHMALPPEQYGGASTTLSHKSVVTGGEAVDVGQWVGCAQPLKRLKVAADSGVASGGQPQGSGDGAAGDGATVDSPHRLYKGVTWVASKGKWRAQLGLANTRKLHLGYFDNQHDAARAYDKASLEHNKILADTNFPINDYVKKRSKPKRRAIATMEEVVQTTARQMLSCPQLRSSWSGELKISLSMKNVVVEAICTAPVACLNKAVMTKAVARSSQNRPVKESQFMGVLFVPKNQKWKAVITINDGVKRKVRLGVFDTEEEAARAYDKHAVQLRGGNAKTNFPATQYTEV